MFKHALVNAFKLVPDVFVDFSSRAVVLEIEIADHSGHSVRAPCLYQQVLVKLHLTALVLITLLESAALTIASRGVQNPLVLVHDRGDVDKKLLDSGRLLVEGLAEGGHDKN